VLNTGNIVPRGKKYPQNPPKNSLGTPLPLEMAIPSKETYCVGLRTGHHGAVTADCACNSPLQLSEPA